MNKIKICLIVLLAVFIGYIIGVGKSFYAKTNLQRLPTVYSADVMEYSNCFVRYNKDGWLGVLRQGESIPGLTFYAELKNERDGRIKLQ